MGIYGEVELEQRLLFMGLRGGSLWGLRAEVVVREVVGGVGAK